MALLLTFYPFWLNVAAAKRGTGSVGRQLPCQWGKHQLLVLTLAMAGTPGSALLGSAIHQCPCSVHPSVLLSPAGCQLHLVQPARKFWVICWHRWGEIWPGLSKSTSNNTRAEISRGPKMQTPKLSLKAWAGGEDWGGGWLCRSTWIPGRSVLQKTGSRMCYLSQVPAHFLWNPDTGPSKVLNQIQVEKQEWNEMWTIPGVSHSNLDVKRFLIIISDKWCL